VQPTVFVSPDGTGPLSVIVADDVFEIQLLMEMWLREAGCTVKCASTGNELTRLVRQQHFDLIVTDVLMPDGDGLDVILELKRSRPKARVLAISGGGRRLQASECLKFAKGLGAHDVLLKPFNREQFMAAVSRVTQGGA
jgi:CheY-like chemotaxis protein